ncbi:xanthine dehydrogenase family protein molybdopterin-binding subunit [Desulfomicrobium escambiense]|uniref:xanthine dehydrogenase family protein molybdopterin-binding subunit n=1 Tax=Desulfomicrobium escambiense TaxID=29503 RepID=UPI0003F56AE5|nr:xanthine dehydrogenase family protein molybdopterin-binding subunit [Desulfomicrobium escambiense]
MNEDVSRRYFLKGGLLVLAVAITPGALVLMNVSPGAAAPATPFRPHAFLELDADGSVTVWVGQTDLGQGTHTGIAMIIADEMDADWNRVRVRMALAAEPFKDPEWGMQATGGSTSIRHRWDMLRKAGAAARLMLVQAAARQWGVDPAVCTTAAGQVRHPDGRGIGYGDLAAKAAALRVPADPPLKNAADYAVIGTLRRRLDMEDKVQGRTAFGIDFRLPGMCVAVLARPPRFGARPVAVDADGARQVRGVLDVIPVGDAVAVCAESTWSALQGRDALKITWSEGSRPDLSDAAIAAELLAKLDGPAAVAEDTGNAAEALAAAAMVVESAYSVPYVAHAQLEPTNCTAHVEKDRCRIWAPTQGQTAAQDEGARICGLPPEKVEVMTTPCGGGFGRRGETDVVTEAVSLSKALGRPVKVVWTRGDEFAHDVFRPASVCRISGGLNGDGKLVVWSHRLVSSSIMSRLWPSAVQNGLDPTSVEGVEGMPYAIPHRRIEYAIPDLPIPVGWLRSVGNSYNCFTVESFMDELALAAGKDPVEFRLGLMEKDSRAHRTLTLLADKADWGGPVPAGRGRGVAVTECFGSAVAQMAEVSVDRGTGVITVHRVVCAVDCGPAVYPDAITAQMEGAVVMGLSIALNERVRFAKGGVATSGFSQYRLLGMKEVPAVEVFIAESRHPVGGIGEPGLPPIAPAVANAVFAATGVRLRELPFSREALKTAVA